MDVRGFVVVVLLCSVCDGLNGIDRFFCISFAFNLFLFCSVFFLFFFFLSFEWVSFNFIHIHIHIYYIRFGECDTRSHEFCYFSVDKKAEWRLKIAFVHPASVVHEYFSSRLPFSPQGKNRPPVSRGSRVSRDARYYCLTNVLQSGPSRRRRSFVSREKNGHKSRRKVPLETRCPTLASIYHPISLSLNT